MFALDQRKIALVAGSVTLFGGDQGLLDAFGDADPGIGEWTGAFPGSSCEEGATAGEYGLLVGQDLTEATRVRSSTAEGR